MDLSGLAVGGVVGAVAGTVITAITTGASRKKLLADNLTWVKRELAEIKDKAKGLLGDNTPPPPDVKP